MLVSDFKTQLKTSCDRKDMQSMFAVAARRSNWVFRRGHAFRRSHASSSSTSRTASPTVHAVDHDPAIFSGEPEDGMEPENFKSKDRNIKEKPDKDQDWTNNLVRPSQQAKPTRGPSSKLESAGVNEPLGPIVQQKRKHTTALQEANCTGIDGSPLAKEDENKSPDSISDERDYQEYYKHRKASPLAEIEVADTRKPISQATDSATGSEKYVGGGGDVVGWRVVQDTAEEALLRAAETWKRRVMEGDPNAPQSMVLRALLKQRLGSNVRENAG